MDCSLCASVRVKIHAVKLSARVRVVEHMIYSVIWTGKHYLHLLVCSL